MSTPKLGTLKARILVDGGMRVHHGSGDTITGKLILAYAAPISGLGFVNRGAPTASLFGPLNIGIILHGRVRVKVRIGNSHRLPTDHSIDLFRHSSEVFKGSLKAEPGDTFEYTWAIDFPQPAVDLYNGKRSYAELMASGDSRGRLPLTFSTYFVDQPDVITLSVGYYVGCHISMPGIEIKVVGPEGDARPLIMYSLPLPPRSLVTSNKAVSQAIAQVQSEHLLPEDQRPRGFKQKAKAIFTSSHFPEFTTDVKLTYQQYVYPGQRLSFDVALRHRESAEDGAEIPEITLESFSVDFRAYTIVDVSDRLIGPPQCIDRRTIQNLVCQTGMAQQVSKSSDYSFEITTDALKNNVCSFVHHNVSRQYLLQVRIQLKIANESVKIKRELPVVLVPAPVELLETPATAAEAADLPSYMRAPLDDEQLPAYGEAGSSTLLRSA